jgi:hypothetical protein
MKAGDTLKGEISQSLLFYVTHGVVVTEDRVVLKHLCVAAYIVYVEVQLFPSS